MRQPCRLDHKYRCAVRSVPDAGNRGFKVGIFGA